MFKSIIIKISKNYILNLKKLLSKIFKQNNDQFYIC